MPGLPSLRVALISYAHKMLRTQRIVPELNTLNSLPVELILLISDLLSPNDLSCLSMSDRRLFAILYRKRSKCPLLIEIAKLPILQRLERDMPDYFVCHCCFLLHKYCRTESVGACQRIEWSRDLPCIRDAQWKQDRFKLHTHGFTFHTSYLFCLLHLQIAMRRFYHGPQCSITAKSLAHVEITEYDRSTTLFSIEAQICPKSPTPGLCLRIRDIIFVKRGKQGLSAHSSKIKQPPQVSQNLLPHQSFKILKLVRPIITAYTTIKPVLPLRSNCNQCKTDFELAIQEYGDNVALLITRWINLGPGLTPDGLRWKAHTHNGMSEEPDTLVIDIAESPRVSFETASHGGSLQDLSSRHLSYLKDEKYKEVMVRFPCPRNVTWSYPTRVRDMPGV